jgi:uncharacterized phage protein gp47/JayE
MSSLIQLPTFPTTTDVLASLQAALQALNPLLTNFNAGGATETYLEAASLLTGSDASTYPGVVQKGAYELLALVQGAEFILTASGTFLDLKAADVGITRKPAVGASGPVVFYATVNSLIANVIPEGTLVAAESADPTVLPAVYATQADATIPIGGAQSNTVIALAVSLGSAGNQSVIGAVNTVVSGATGVSVASTGTMGGGADVEQDDSPNGGLRARALQAIPNASQCTLTAIEADAINYPGITSAVATDINIDPTIARGIVELYVDDGTGNLGDASNANYVVLATMQTDFNRGLYHAAGTQVNVQGSLLLPTTVSLVVGINLAYATDISPAAAIILLVRSAVYNYVQAVGIGSPVLLSEIIRIAAEVAGVSDVPITAVTINGAGSNLQPLPTQACRCVGLGNVLVTYALVTY